MVLAVRARHGWQGLTTTKPAAHILRAFFNLIAFLSYYFAISRMPLVDAVSIVASYPIFLTLLSGLVLAEHPNGRQILAIITGFIGVIFIVQPGGSEVDWLGAGAALFGCLMFAALAIQTRRMSVSESTELMLLTGSALILLVSALAAPFLWIQPSANEFALMLLLGLIGLGGQYFLTNGFKYAPVYIVGALEYSTGLGCFLRLGYFSRPADSDSDRRCFAGGRQRSGCSRVRTRQTELTVLEVSSINFQCSRLPITSRQISATLCPRSQVKVNIGWLQLHMLFATV